MGASMNLQNPPEIADGGYWYVVPVVPDPDLGGHTPGVVAGTGWCAWYTATQAAVRCPEPVVGLQTDETLAATVLAEAGYAVRPFGRIGGS